MLSNQFSLTVLVIGNRTRALRDTIPDTVTKINYGTFKELLLLLVIESTNHVDDSAAILDEEISIALIDHDLHAVESILTWERQIALIAVADEQELLLLSAIEVDLLGALALSENYFQFLVRDSAHILLLLQLQALEALLQLILLLRLVDVKSNQLAQGL